MMMGTDPKTDAILGTPRLNVSQFSYQRLMTTTSPGDEAVGWQNAV